MKKKIFPITAFVTAMFLIIGCNNTANVSAGQDEMMVMVEHNRYYNIWVDKDTGVMYLIKDDKGSGFTVMLNADGTPKIWQGDIKEYVPDFLK